MTNVVKEGYLSVITCAINIIKDTFQWYRKVAQIPPPAMQKELLDFMKA